MSGLGQPRTSGTTFIKTKDSKFYKSTDKENTTPYTSLEGTLTGMYFEEESFGGKTFEKLYIGVQAEEEHFTFGVSLMGDMWSMLISFLKSADLREPVQFEISSVNNTYMKDGVSVTKPKTMIFVKQCGTSVKSFFKKGSGNELPAWEQVQVGKKTMWVKDAWEDALRACVNEMNTIISGNVGSNPQPPTPATQPQQTPASPQFQPTPDVVDDDLPF